MTRKARSFFFAFLTYNILRGKILPHVFLSPPGSLNDRPIRLTAMRIPKLPRPTQGNEMVTWPQAAFYMTTAVGSFLKTQPPLPDSLRLPKSPLFLGRWSWTSPPSVCTASSTFSRALAFLIPSQAVLPRAKGTGPLYYFCCHIFVPPFPGQSPQNFMPARIDHPQVSRFSEQPLSPSSSIELDLGNGPLLSPLAPTDSAAATTSYQLLLSKCFGAPRRFRFSELLPAFPLAYH